MRALYLRTSTDKQTGNAQRMQLEQAARARGWIPSDVHVPEFGTRVTEAIVGYELSAGTIWFEDDGVSGRRGSRPAIDTLINLARTGCLTDLLTTSIDRLGRSTVDVLHMVDEFTTHGIVITTVREGQLDSRTPMGRCILTWFSGFAELEHGLIRDRVVVGQLRARKMGKHCGRPRRAIPAETIEKARQLRRRGRSWRQIAMAVKVPERTIRDAVGEALDVIFSGAGKVPPNFPAATP